jgi:hypothetical protein
MMPKSRYRIMADYMPKVGSRGLDMMFRTCTVQVNLDFATEADMVRKLRVALALQPLATVRSLPPVAYRSMRFLMHASLALGALTDTAARHAGAFMKLVNTEFCTLAGDAGAHLVAHTRNDWALVARLVNRNSEDVVTLMHTALERAARPLPSVAGAAAAVTHAFDTFGGNCGQPVRNAFEEAFALHVVRPVFSDPSGVEARLSDAQRRYKTAASDEGAAFVGELRELTEIESFSPERRAQLLPALWRYRQRFCMADVAREVHPTERPDAAARHPLLSHVLTREPDLRGLRHLPQLYAFTNLLLNRHSRRLDRASAKRVTVRDAIRDAAEPHAWAAAFDSVRRAFNATWRHVEMIECQKNLLVDFEVDESTSISHFLPYRADEGFYLSEGVATFLGTQHNKLVELGAQCAGAAVRSIPTVDSRLFTAAHAIDFDLARFEAHVEKNCVQLSQAGAVVVDYAAAEQHLLEHCVAGRPFFHLAERSMVYISSIDDRDEEGDGSGSGSGSGSGEAGDIDVPRVSSKVPQEALAADAADALLTELGTRAAKKAVLRWLETSVALLQETGGEAVLDVGRTLLVDFLQSDLQLSGADMQRELGGGGARTMPTLYQHVQLCHIASAHQHLAHVLGLGPWAGVREDFLARLDAAGRQAVRDMVRAPPMREHVKRVLELLLAFIQTQVRGMVSGAGSPVRDFFAYVAASDDETVEDLPWFESFSDALLMRHVVDVYETMVASVDV